MTSVFGFLASIAVVILVHILGVLVVRWLGVRSRTAMAVAGLTANLLLAIVVFAGMFAFVGESVIAPRVDDLVPDGAAAKAGFKVGDLVVSIDRSRVKSFADMNRFVSTSAERELTFEVERGDTSVLLKVTPARREVSDRLGNKVALGVIGIRRNAKSQVEFKRYGPVDAVGLGIKETYSVIARAAAYLQAAIIGREAAVLGGPFTIANVSGEDVARVRLEGLLNFTGVLSACLGFVLGFAQFAIRLLAAPFKRASL